MDTMLVFVEIKGGEPRKASLECLSEGRKLRDAGNMSVDAIVFGKLPDAAREKILPYVNRLVRITDTALESYTAEGYAAALAKYAAELGPKLIIAGATTIGRDFLPRAAVILGAGIASDVTEAHWSENPLRCVRPIYGGKVLTEVSITGSPAMVTTRPNAFGVEPANDGKGDYVERELGISAEQVKTRVVRVEEEKKERPELTEADIIVSGGRGMKAAENFKLLEDMADVIGAAVGATRSVVDAKWRPEEDQVGKSGKTVSPKLYMAFGLSGAIHHIMGMDTSKVVLAVNKDPNAIIFNYADYGIEGDLFEVIPAMTEELKKRMGK